jgi:hypothetical protein
MSLTTIGLKCIADAIVGGTTYTKFNAANAYLGVGSSSNAFDVGQTDLQTPLTPGGRKGMDSTYPLVTDNVITFKATFGPTDAVGVWNENGIFNASTAGQMLTRAVETLITKTSQVSVVFTKTLTIST